MDWLFSCKFVTLTDRVDRVIGVKATFSEANLDSESLWLSESESGSSTAKEKEKKPLILTNLNQFLQCPPLLTLQITNIKFIYLFTSLLPTACLCWRWGRGMEEGKTLHFDPATFVSNQWNTYHI